MIEQFRFPFTRWRRSHGDWGFKTTDSPSLEWIDDARGRSFGTPEFRMRETAGWSEFRMRETAGWSLHFDHVLEPRHIFFYNAQYKLYWKEDGWQRQETHMSAEGRLDGNHVTDWWLTPDDLADIPMLEAMVPRLRELNEAAFAALPRPQREWLTGCRKANVSLDRCRREMSP